MSPDSRRSTTRPGAVPLPGRALAAALSASLLLLPVTAARAAGQAAEDVAARRALTLAGARKAADAAAAEARRLGAGGAIAVVDDGGHVLFVERLDGTFPAASEVAIAKARTAATFRRPTAAFEEAIRNGRTSLVAVAPMTPLEGGQPIVVGGEVLGAVGVSGAMSSKQDDELAIVAVRALTGAASAGTSGER